MEHVLTMRVDEMLDMLRYDLPSFDSFAHGEKMKAKRIALSLDESARAFYDEAYRQPYSLFQLWRFRSIERRMTHYDAAGKLNIFSMHLLSSAQIERLQITGESLLDIGAGDGGVTRHFLPFFGRIDCVESSKQMRKRLIKSGFQTFDADQWPIESRQYSAISMLNLLDRCSYPIQTLQRAYDALENDGLLIIATPLPFRPHVHAIGHTVDPNESLSIEGDDWEACAHSFVETIEALLNINLHSISRLPYMCRGFADEPLIALDDALFVFKKTSSSTLSSRV